jgi:hypothetical protein
VSVDLLFPDHPDPARRLRVGSLCTGYRGLDLGVRAVLGGELVSTADPDRHVRAVLAARFPGVPNLGDITRAQFTFLAAQYPVDVLTAGTGGGHPGLAPVAGGVAGGVPGGGADGGSAVVWSVEPPTVAAAAVAGVLGLAAGIWLRVARRRAARRDAAGGRWWEITPPARLGPGSAVAVWQLLGGLLRRHPGPWWWPARLVVEVIATGDAVRVGLWLPPALHTDALDWTLAAALPGARINPGPNPVWPAAGVSAVELVPRGGIWAPVLDPTMPALLAHATRNHDGSNGEREPLRLLYALLATRTRAGDQAVVQFVVRTHRGTHARALGTTWGGGGAGVLDGPTRVLLLLAHGVGQLAALLGRELLELLTAPAAARTANTRSGRPQLRTGPQSGDPVAAAHRAARDAKRAGGPHLRVTLRLGLATRGRGRDAMAARRRRLGELTGGFDLVTTPLRTHPRRRHPARLLTARLLGAWFTATTTELAGLWHLPTEPGRYRLVAAPARDRAPIPDLLAPAPRPRPVQQRPATAARPPPSRGVVAGPDRADHPPRS